ncbi:MAG: copper chaperone CopZ [Clostridiales bacterium]|jgi:copper ion binding protein|nr:copper chaperone CopZ [Clostridiales bacterium]
MKKKVLVEGMSCEHCIKHVSEALKELSGVTKVDVNLEAKTAFIEATQEINDEDIKFAIDEAGYEVAGIEVQ